MTDRKQRVVLSGVESEWESVSSGVPQGSILGPSLFIMYVNDLPSSLAHSKCLLYADDVKIFKRISSFADCLDLQRDLVSFTEWCCKWRLNLNISKCFCMNFSLKRSLNIVFNYSLDDHVLLCLSETKDLGVIFSSNMSFSAHITNIVNKALRMLGFVRRTMRHVNDIGVLKVLYNSYVRSGLDYCSPVWSPSAKVWVQKLERVQKRFIKVLCAKKRINYDSDNYVDLCNLFSLTTLERRRKICDLILFHKILHSKVNSFYLVSSISLNVPSRRSRHTNVFASRKRRLLLTKNSYIPRCVSHANSMTSVDFFNDDFLLFKRLTSTSLTL